MSGDTLECAECDASVFDSASGRWSEDMPNQFCPSCGAELTIFVDDGGPGEAVASTRVAYQGSPSQLRAEVERLTEDAVESANLSTDIANRRDAYKKERDTAKGEAARLREQLDREAAEVAAGAKDRDKMRRQFAETDARLRERVAAAESPQRATAVIAAWLKLNGPMRERDGYSYAIGENLTAPEVRNGLGDDGWCFLAGDDNTVDVGDLDLSDIHGTPTGATPKTSMTGPEFAAAARASGVFTPGSVAEIRASIERHRGDPAKHVDAFFGTLSSDETDEEIIDSLATADDGATPSEPACARCGGSRVIRSVSVDMSGKLAPPSPCPNCHGEPGGES